MTESGQSRRTYSRASVARTLHMRPAAAIDYLQRAVPECVYHVSGKVLIDAAIFDAWFDARRHPRFERRKELDEDWIEKRLAEEFG